MASLSCLFKDLFSFQTFNSQLLYCSANETEGDMLIANFLDLLRSWRRYNSSLRELNQLGDRELADIGISRSDIPRVAWENSQR